MVIVEAATGKEVAKVQLCDESDQVALSGSFAAALAGNKLCYLEYSGEPDTSIGAETEESSRK